METTLRVDSCLRISYLYDKETHSYVRTENSTCFLARGTTERLQILSTEGGLVGEFTVVKSVSHTQIDTHDT